MAGGASTTSSLVLTPTERTAYSYLFKLADKDNVGVLTGDAAVKFFAGSGLPPHTLGEIWAIADVENNGFLTQQSFSVALRLIGHAQKGEAIGMDTIGRPGPLPTFEGVTIPGLPSGGAPPSINTRPGAAVPISISPEDRARYTRIFATSGPHNGLLDGDKAKDIFVKSKLPFEKLGAIWSLADTKTRGALDLTDFIIAMYFIQGTMSGTISTIPATLPPGLYEAAAGRSGSSSGPHSPIPTQFTGGSASGGMRPPASPLQANLTGVGVPGRTGTPLSPSALGPVAAGGAAAMATGGKAWDIAPAEKAKADGFFDMLDKDKKGILEGQIVVPFLLQSKLPEAVLAQVWDLADIRQAGQLTRDEFAVAMHLINDKLSGKELPATLPAGLVPPSPKGAQPDAPKPSETQQDLFSLMDDDLPPSSVPASASSFGPTPAASSTAFQPSSSPAAAARAAPSALGPSPFGSDFSPAPSAMPATGAKDLLSDDEEEPPKAGVAGATGKAPLSDDGAEIGNKRNQLASTEKALSDLRNRRTELESTVATTSAQRHELEVRLSQSRAAYDTESKTAKELQERAAQNSAEMGKLREELIRAESELSALRLEKSEIEQGLLKDKEDIRDMKRKMVSVEDETKALRVNLEKIKKDARQQRGLVAITKKQLSTAETERDKAKAAISEAQAAVAAGGDVEQESPAGSAASGVGAPERALSPALSDISRKSTNPFERLTATHSDSTSPAPTASSNPSLDAAAALGAAGGAAVGLGAASATAHAEKGTGEGQSDFADPFGMSSSAASIVPAATGSSAFDDAFVPHTSASSAAPAPILTASPQEVSVGAGGGGFGDAFGPKTTTGDGGAAGSDFDHTGFDDDFDSSFTPVASQGKQEEGAGFSQDTPKGGAFDDAFKELDEPQSATTEATAVPATAPKREESEGDEDSDTSSDDEDEGPEDLAGTRDTLGGGDQAEAGPSSSSGATVLAPHKSLSEIETKFPPLEDVGAAPHSAVALSTATTATFHDASSDTPVDSHFTDGGVQDRSGTAVEEPPFLAVSSSSGPQRRAPPPVPPPRGASSSSTSTAQSPPPATVSLANRDESPFGMGFAPVGPTSTAAPLPTTGEIPNVPPKAATVPAPGDSASPSQDDFDSAFEDLGAADVAPTGGAHTSSVSDAGATGVNDFDDATFNDDDFNFVPSFDTPSAAPAAADTSTSGAGAEASLPGAFPTGGDAAAGAFDGFDDAFRPSHDTSHSSGTGANAGVGEGHVAGATGGSNADSSALSFDDAFGPTAGTSSSASGTGPASTVTPAPQAPQETKAQPLAPSPALEDDAGPVRQLCGMGFSRQQAIDALEKTNYNVQKALNQLLG